MTEVQKNLFKYIDTKSIDPERIVNDEQNLAKEFFCDICQDLLWKPKACSLCQHLFCQQCIKIWLQFNPTLCPFCCEPYEEKRPPPYIHSLLGLLTIRCRNSSFGCQEVLSYDRLEHHETIECQFLSQQCRICGKSILINDIEQHRLSCQSTTVRCFICKNLIDRTCVSQHLIGCMRDRLDSFIDEIIPTPDELGLPVVENEFNLTQQLANRNLFERFNYRIERILPAIPQVNLIGFDRVQQTRTEHIFLRFWTVLQLIWFNKSRALQIIVLLICFGIGFLIGFTLGLSIFIQNQMKKSVYRALIYILIFTGSVTSILSYIFWFCTLMLFCYKIILLILRLYIFYIPFYLSAGGLAWLIVFITFHLRRM